QAGKTAGGAMTPEDPLLGAELAAADVVRVPLAPARDELRELGVRRIGQHDAELHVLVAGGISLRRRDALALEAEDRAGVGAARHLDGDGAVDGGDGDAGTNHGLLQAHRQLDVDVAPLALIEAMRLDLDLDIGVAGGAA